MKKAVISSGGKQYLVGEGETLLVDILPKSKSLEFEPLLVIDGESSRIGKPTVEGSKVSAQIIEEIVKADKVLAIRYKAKKRVHKVRGHRQGHSQIKITKIS